jgi:hypothetical protein
MAKYKSILEKLEVKNVVDFDLFQIKGYHDRVRVGSALPYLFTTLTKHELIQLISELQEMADKMQD